MSTRRRHAVRGLYTVIDRTVPDLDKPASDPHVEKFMDPMYDVFGSSAYRVMPAPRPEGLASVLNRAATMNNQQPDVEVGLEYLADVPNDAESRIAAIRKKIGAKPPPDAKPENYGRSLREMLATREIIEKSRIQLNQFALKAVDTYRKVNKSAETASKIASSLGIPPYRVEDEAREIAAFAEKSDAYQTLDRAIRDYGPIANAITVGVMRLIDGGATGYTSQPELAAATQVIDTIIPIAMAVPVYGWVVGAALSFVNSVLKDAVSSADDWCRERVDVIVARMQRVLQDGLPFPTHATRIFPLSIDGKPTCVSASYASSKEDVGRDPIADLSQLSLKVETYSIALNVQPRADLQRWWAIAQTYLYHPAVSQVFEALCRDASGGTLASDEQVMLVAAPVATAFGFDIDEIAVELHRRCPGYRSMASSFERPVEGGNIIATDGTTRTICEVYPQFCSFPHNAWLLQLVALSRTVFQIVEERRNKVGLIKLALVPPAEGSAGLVMPAALGVGAGLVAINVLGLSGPVGWAVGLGAFLASNLLSSRD